MLGWSINLFRVRGIQLSVHASFFLLLAWFAKDGWDSGGLSDMVISVGLLVAFFTCVVLHEFGHSFTAMHFGIGVRRILLMPIGGMAEFQSIPREPSRELLITLAGPAVNFAIAALLWAVVGLPEGFPLHSEFIDRPSGYAQMLLQWNLMMGFFNLLPIFPMDGGRIFRALLAWHMPYLRATLWAANVGKVLAVIAGLLALFVWNSPLTAVLFAFIFLAGETEYRVVRRHEVDEVRWREMLARYYEPLPPKEPPILSH